MTDCRVPIRPSAGDPLSLLALQLLDDVMSDSRVAVVQWRSPFASTAFGEEGMSSVKVFRATGLVVMGDDSCLRGDGFESRHHILDGHDIFHIDFCKNCIVCLKRRKINE